MKRPYRSQYRKHPQSGNQRFTSASHSNKVKLRNCGRGVLVTAGSAAYTSQALREALNVIRLHTDEQSAESASSPTAEVAAVLEAELQQLKDQYNRFVPIENLSKGVSFIQFNSPADEPNSFVFEILNSLAPVNPLLNFAAAPAASAAPAATTEPAAPAPSAAPATTAAPAGTTAPAVAAVVPTATVEVDNEASSKIEEEKQRKRMKIKCRFMNRLIPIEISCSPHADHFKRAARLLVESYFPQSDFALQQSRPNITKESVESATKETGKSDENKTEPGEQLSDRTGPGEQPAERTGPEQQLRGRTGPGEQVLDRNENLRDAEGTEASSEEKKFKAAFAVPTGGSWAIHFERRSGMKTLDRDFVIEEIGKLVGPKYRVNLGSPEYTVIVELNNVFLGLSVVRDFNRLLKFNIHRLIHPESEAESEAGTGAGAKTGAGAGAALLQEGQAEPSERLSAVAADDDNDDDDNETK